MTRLTLRAAAPLMIGVLALTVLTGCATPRNAATSSGGAGNPFPSVPLPPDGEVAAQGTVMDVGGDVQLCLGPVAESYPPQCSGIPVANWSWQGIDGSETSDDVTWGAYAVQGTYDGHSFSVTQPPIMLALYDPMPFADPTDGVAGTTDETTLLGIQDDLPGWLGSDGSVYLGSGPDNGRLWVDVVWDDGTYQDAADAAYGADVVVIRPALRPVS